MVQWYFNESCHDECGYVGEFHDGNGYRGYNIGLERERVTYLYHSIGYPMTLLSRMVIMVYHSDMI